MTTILFRRSKNDVERRESSPVEVIVRAPTADTSASIYGFSATAG